MSHHDEHEGAPPGSTEAGGPRTDEPAGIKTGPPGAGDRDDAEVEKGVEKLERVEAGH
jgi:hypothetical protein